MKEMRYKDYDCEVKKGKYSNNNNLALVLLDKEDGSMITTATLNTDDKLSPDMGYIKNYSEGEGMLEALQEAGLVEEIVGQTNLGYVTVPLVRFNLENVETLQ